MHLLENCGLGGRGCSGGSECLRSNAGVIGKGSASGDSVSYAESCFSRPDDSFIREIESLHIHDYPLSTVF